MPALFSGRYHIDNGQRYYLAWTQALRQAREQRPDLVWRFAAIGAQREFIAGAGDLRAATLRNLLTLLEGDRS